MTHRPGTVRLAHLLVAVTLLAPGIARADEAPPPEAGKRKQTVVFKEPIPEAPEPGSSWADPSEPVGKRQIYLGLRYRAAVVPKFLINLFIDEGKNVFVHSGALELEVRRDHFAIIPYVGYTRYFMDDTLFLEKNKDKTAAGSYSVANSSLHGFYAGIDLLWGFQLGRYVEFETGLGLGVAYIHGDLINRWVYDDPNGKFTASTGKTYTPCATRDDGSSCQKETHTDATVDKVGNFKEPNWFNGGTVPPIYARITAPLLGFRFKPMRDVAIRIQGGLSLTEGFMFGANLDFRLPGG